MKFYKNNIKQDEKSKTISKDIFIDLSKAKKFLKQNKINNFNFEIQKIIDNIRKSKEDFKRSTGLGE